MEKEKGKIGNRKEPYTNRQELEAKSKSGGICIKEGANPQGSKKIIPTASGKGKNKLEAVEESLGPLAFKWDKGSSCSKLVKD